MAGSSAAFPTALSCLSKPEMSFTLVIAIAHSEHPCKGALQ